MLSSTDQHALNHSREHLRKAGVHFAEGLRSEEFDRWEAEGKFRFPPDLRWFLAGGVPMGSRFPDWRSSWSMLAQYFTWPSEGICFEIREANYWRQEWGARPADDNRAIETAASYINAAPTLIPIYGHSYLPSEPCSENNPVFSVYQTDIIHRGSNLAEYLLWLFHDEDSLDEGMYPVYSEKYQYIRFWTDLVRENTTLEE